MRYVYYYLWICVASLYNGLFRLLLPLRRLQFKLKGARKEEQERHDMDLNEGFYGFPGGIVDWFAFAFLLALVFAPILVLVISFDMETRLFDSELWRYSLFIGIGVFCYYWIYFKSIDWLKMRIKKINKKYYL